MSQAPEFPAAPGVRGWSRPPIAAILAGVAAFAGAVPLAAVALGGALWGVFILAGIIRLPWTWGGDPLVVLQLAASLQGGLLVVGFPFLLVTAAIRLLAGRDRLMLVVCCLPVTLVVVWSLLIVLAGGWVNPWLFALLGPAVAPLFALWPSVGGWVAVRAPA
jgi:hypothetical protein